MWLSFGNLRLSAGDIIDWQHNASCSSKPSAFAYEGDKFDMTGFQPSDLDDRTSRQYRLPGHVPHVFNLASGGYTLRLPHANQLEMLFTFILPA